MPAPLAKGVLIAASVLVAAGIAVYENPQVWDWVEKSRRRIALALYNIGDEIHPGHDDEDGAAAAVAAARRKRDEIMATNRERFMREHGSTKSKMIPPPPTGYASFDDFLNRDEHGAYTLQNTATDATGESHVRRRPRVSGGEEHSGQVIFDRTLVDADRMHESDRESTATLGNSDGQHTPRSAAERGPLVDLSTSDHDVTQASSQSLGASRSPVDTYAATNEWANSTSSSFHSAAGIPESEGHLGTPRRISGTSSSSVESMHSFSSAEPISVRSAQTASNASDAGSHTNTYDLLSDDDVEGFSTRWINTPSSWTEVGSEVSDNDTGGAP